MHSTDWRELSAAQRQAVLPRALAAVDPREWLLFFRRLVGQAAQTQQEFGALMERQIAQCEGMIEAFPETEVDLHTAFTDQVQDVQAEGGPSFVNLLLVAAAEAHAPMIEWVLQEYTPPVSHRFADGSTVLHVAAAATDPGNEPTAAVAAVRLLLQAGADPCCEDGQGRTPLSTAAMAEVREVVAAAVAERPASPTPLLPAAADDAEEVRGASTPPAAQSREVGAGGEGSATLGVEAAGGTAALEMAAIAVLPGAENGAENGAAAAAEQPRRAAGGSGREPPASAAGGFACCGSRPKKNR